MKNKIRKIGEKIIEVLLFSSSTISSVTVFLIILFLFKEGTAVFNKSTLKDGSQLIVNSSNTVHEFKPGELRSIFQKQITNWKQLGGADLPIITFSTSDISSHLHAGQQLHIDSLPDQILQIVKENPGVIGVIQNKYVKQDNAIKIISVPNVTLKEIFAGENWYPTSDPVAEIGILPLIIGTLMVAFGAIAFALPIGLAASIYMAEIAPKKFRNILKPVIELLAGIPSVVYGFFGLTVVVPFIQKLFDIPIGENALAGSFILGIMALPTIITISEDALRNTPRSMREASLALGATQWQTIRRVVIPNSQSGIVAALILGIGRAIGETMAVLMVTGNAAVMPHSYLEPMRTIPATIAAELGEASFGGLHFATLFWLGCILFAITFGINLFVNLVLRKDKLKSR